MQPSKPTPAGRGAQRTLVGDRRGTELDRAGRADEGGVEALATLEQVRGLHPKLVFPGQKNGKLVSDTTLRALLKRRKRTEITAHGFRSTFRDWVSDATDFSGDLAEHCLAPRVGGAEERAYARSDRLGKRGALLEAWETHCLSGRESAAPEASVAEVGAFA